MGMMTSVLIQSAMNMPPAPILMVHSNAPVTLVSLVTDSLVLTLMSARPLLPSYPMEIAVMLMHCVRIPLVDLLVLAMPVTRELVSFVLILMSVHLMTSITVTPMLSVLTLKLHSAAPVSMVSLVMVYHVSMTAILNPLAKKTSLAHTLKTELLFVIVSTASS